MSKNTNYTNIICKTDNCNRKVISLGLCRKCYDKQYCKNKRLVNEIELQKNRIKSSLGHACANYYAKLNNSNAKNVNECKSKYFNPGTIIFLVEVCGWKPGKQVSIDHIIPYSYFYLNDINVVRNQLNNINNLRVISFAENQSKSESLILTK